MLICLFRFLKRCTVLAFTKHINKRLCGAGAAIFIPDMGIVVLRRPFRVHSSSKGNDQEPVQSNSTYFPPDTTRERNKNCQDGMKKTQHKRKAKRSGSTNSRPPHLKVIVSSLTIYNPNNRSGLYAICFISFFLCSVCFIIVRLLYMI